MTICASIVDSVSGISGSEIKVQTVVELMPKVVEINTVDLLEESEGALSLKQEQYSLESAHTLLTPPFDVVSKLHCITICFPSKFLS